METGFEHEIFFQSLTWQLTFNDYIQSFHVSSLLTYAQTVDTSRLVPLNLCAGKTG